MRMLMSAPGMLAAELDPPASPLPAAFDVAGSDDARTRFDFCDVACVVFSLPFRVSETIYGHPGYWSSGMRGYVGYWRDKPVSVVSTVLAGDSVGVYSLGTLPQHQRHGFGEALLRYALDDSFRRVGCRSIGLAVNACGLPTVSENGISNCDQISHLRPTGRCRTMTRLRRFEAALRPWCLHPVPCGPLGFPAASRAGSRKPLHPKAPCRFPRKKSCSMASSGA